MTYLFRPGASVVTDSNVARVYQPSGAGNGLLNNLVYFLGSDEAGGANNALDKHVNALTFTQRNAPGAGGGLVYPTARTFNGTNQMFDRASEALLNVGNNDCTMTVWIYPTAYPAPASTNVFYHKWLVSLSWLLTLNPGGVIQTQLSANGAAASIILASVATAPLNAWSFVALTYEFNSNTAALYVDANLPVQGNPTAPGIFAGTSYVGVGAYTTAALRFAGRIGPTMFWKSAPGLGGALDATKRTALYNAGAGLSYAAFTL